MGAWRRSPLAFSRSVLGSEPWAGVLPIYDAISKPHARVAVRGCHASAKTRTAAEIALGFAATGGVVVVTASRFAQIQHGVWARIEELIAEARIPLGVTAKRAMIDFGRGDKILAWSTDNEVRFQGLHAARLLFIVDEAPGVDAGIFRAITGARAGGDVRELALGNPSIPSGPFFDHSHSPEWTALRLDAFDNPNLFDVYMEDAGVMRSATRTKDLRTMGADEVAASVRPYLATRRWVLEQAAEYGVGTPYWTWKVRGEFPQQAEDALILLAWTEAAAAMGPDERPWAQRASGVPDAVEVGIDVSGPGEDEHVVAARCGPDVLSVTPAVSADPAELVARTVDILRALPVPPAVVKVDSIGVGTYFVTHLAAAGFRAVPVNVAEACDGDAARARFVNRKAEYYWHLRERARDGQIRGLGDERTRSQLSTMRWYERGGRIQIESKDEMRRRGLRSPDRAEALMLAYAPLRGMDQRPSFGVPGIAPKVAAAARSTKRWGPPVSRR